TFCGLDPFTPEMIPSATGSSARAASAKAWKTMFFIRRVSIIPHHQFSNSLLPSRGFGFPTPILRLPRSQSKVRQKFMSPLFLLTEDKAAGGLHLRSQIVISKRAPELGRRRIARAAGSSKRY